MGFIIQEGGPYQFDFTSPVKLVKNNKMGKGFNILQSFFILRKYFDPPDAFRGKDALYRYVLFGGIR
jgi:hypothetical protein